MKPGTTLVQHTTSDPATAERIGREVADRGIRVLDAALSGGPHDIAAGTLTLWVGGDAAVLEEMRPLLQSYASPIRFVGSIGTGQRVKLVNNALFVAQVRLAIDAVRLGGSLDLDLVLEVAQRSGADLGIIGTVLSSDVIQTKVLVGVGSSSIRKPGR